MLRLQWHLLCVPLEYLLESLAPTCLWITLNVGGNPAELVELIYPLLKRYETPASTFIGGDPHSWCEAATDTLRQADVAAAGPLLELLERYGGVTSVRMLERTGDNQRRSRSLSLFPRKLERLDPVSRRALRAAYTTPAAYSTGDWERVRRSENSDLVRPGLYGQDPHPTTGLCAKDCLGRTHRQLQQRCAAPLPTFCQARATLVAMPA